MMLGRHPKKSKSKKATSKKINRQKKAKDKKQKKSAVRQTWWMMLGRHPAPNWAAQPPVWTAPSALFNSPCCWSPDAEIDHHHHLLPLVGQNQPLLLLDHCQPHQQLVDLVTQLELVGGGQLMVRCCWCVGANPDSHHPRKGRARACKGLRSSTISFALLYTQRACEVPCVL